MNNAGLHCQRQERAIHPLPPAATNYHATRHFVTTLEKSFFTISVPLPQNKDHYHTLMVEKEGGQHTPLFLNMHRKHLS